MLACPPVAAVPERILPRPLPFSQVGFLIVLPQRIAVQLVLERAASQILVQHLVCLCLIGVLIWAVAAEPVRRVVNLLLIGVLYF